MKGRKSQSIDESASEETGRIYIYFRRKRTYLKQMSALRNNTADVNIQDDDGETLLHMALARNDVKGVELIMSRTPDLSIRNDVGDTYLHAAACTEKNVPPEIIQKLLRSGVCPNLQNRLGFTPLHVAIINSNIQLMKYLLDINVKTDIQDICTKWTPLHHATEAFDPQAALLLLKYGADPNIRDASGQSPLFNAVSAEYPEVIIEMLNRGANVDICDRIGQTPFHFAARCRDSVPLQLLLNREPNININAQTHKGQTPLHCAIESGRSENVAFILQQEPDLDIQDNQGLHAFDLFLDHQSIEHVVKLNVAKLTVSQHILNMVYTGSDSGFIKQFEKECSEELEGMKETVVPNLAMNFYKFLSLTTQRRAEIVMKNIARTYSEAKRIVMEKYPIYWSILCRRIVEAEDRARELAKLEDEKHKIFSGLPDNCVNSILMYLSIADIRILLEASEVLVR